MAILRCQICFEDLARFNNLTIRRPITGDQFLPITPNMPLPFPEPAELVDWEAMRCPYCNKRPIIDEEFLYTSTGKLIQVKEREQANGNNDGGEAA